MRKTWETSKSNAISEILAC